MINLNYIICKLINRCGDVVMFMLGKDVAVDRDAMCSVAKKSVDRGPWDFETSHEYELTLGDMFKNDNMSLMAVNLRGLGMEPSDIVSVFASIHQGVKSVVEVSIRPFVYRTYVGMIYRKRLCK